jgi:hypothetical protein
MNKIKEIFTTKKIVDFKFLNILGLQAARYILAKILYSASKYFIKTDYIPEYKDKGLHLYNRFLENENFQNIKNEFNQIIEKENKSRNTYFNKNELNVKNSSIDYLLFEFEDKEENKKNYPFLYALYKSDKIDKILKAAERKKNVNIFMRLERVITKDDKMNDVNSKWHVDNYHDTHKAWLYLTDVKKENGPFNYLSGSANFSFKRLYWEYINSVKSFMNMNYVPFFLEKNFNLSKLDKLEMECDKNDFLVANTHGYHKRGYAQINQIRDAVSFYTRENPYKFF